MPPAKSARTQPARPKPAGAKPARSSFRTRSITPVDALVGMALLAGAALTILPMMATLACFALIAAAVHRFSPAPRRAAIRVTPR